MRWKGMCTERKSKNEGYRETYEEVENFAHRLREEEEEEEI